MLGAVIGDVVGSAYEFEACKTKDFSLITDRSIYTDDSILTVAVADVMLNGGAYTSAFKRYYDRYPNPCGGYGARFQAWASSPDPQPYGSWGNGAAMRVSPVAYGYDSLCEVLQAAEQTAAVTHNHPEGIRGARATAAAIFLARQGYEKAVIRDRITADFGYDLSQSLDQIRADYGFDESCQGTVPPAITAFLESTDFVDALRNAVSLGGDADTLTCITGSIAEAFYGRAPDFLLEAVWQRLPQDLRGIILQFDQRYALPLSPPVESSS